MVKILPFKGIRPVPDKVHLVVSRTYISYSKEEIKQKLESNLYSFIHIINPDFKDNSKSKEGSTERFTKIRQRFNEFLKEKIFIRDKKKVLYLYNQIDGSNEYTGIIACTSVDDFINGKIKKHENTLLKREKKLMNYLANVKINAEPVTLFFKDDKELNNIFKKIKQLSPLYDFTTTDKIRHRIFMVDNKQLIYSIKKIFEKKQSLYIADGHHRIASSVLYAKERKKELNNCSGKEAFNFFMSFLLPESQLKIFSFTRLLKGINIPDINLILSKLNNYFNIYISKKYTYPHKKTQFGMYVKGNYYFLNVKKTLLNKLKHKETGFIILDSNILNNYILSPLFGINDIRNDKRISFIDGKKDFSEIVNLINKGEYDIAFTLYPVTVKDLKKIADNNNAELMPPKTTWIEPKLRSGLILYDISDDYI